MSDTHRLALPLLAAAQAQKHVTHNEALTALDALVHLTFVTRSLSAPPVAGEGAAYLIASGATSAWSGRDGEIAAWQNGAWSFFTPVDGMMAFVADEQIQIVYSSSAWQRTGAALASDMVVAQGTGGAESRHQVIETELTGLTGSSATAAALIPDRAVVFCVSSRTSTAISGAASYDCGISGEINKFGGSLGVAQGSSNLGVIGPTAFYAPTDVVLTANGGAFSTGAVKLAVHCFLPVAPA